MARRIAALFTIAALWALSGAAWAATTGNPPTPMTLSGTVVISRGAGTVADGLTVHSYINGQNEDGSVGTPTSNAAFTDLAVEPTDPSLVGSPVGFTVGGLAATGVLTGCSNATATSEAPVTFMAGAICTAILTVVSPPPTTVSVTGTSAATATTPSTVTVGGSSTSVPDTTATASGGTGTVAVSQYASNPGPAPTTFTAGNTFFDVSVAPVSSGSRTFTTLVVQQCSLTAGQVLYWLNVNAWQAVSPQTALDSSGCVTATLSGSSSPTIAQLTGTAFTVSAGTSTAPPPPPPSSSSSTTTTSSKGGGANAAYVQALSPTAGPAGTHITITGVNFTGASIVFFNGVVGDNLVVVSDSEITVDAPAGLKGAVDVTIQNNYGTSAVVPADEFTYGAAVPASASITSAGGTLTTADGTFTMTVPAGAISGTASLSLTESSAAPSGLPAGFAAASPTFTLAGATLTSPAEAVIHYQPAALNGLPAARLAAYAQQASGAWAYVPTLVGSGTVSVNVSGPATLAVLVNTSALSDVAAGYWAAPQIDALLAAGVVTGFPDGTFQPDAALTRAQFVKMLDAALGLQPGTSTAAFSDVPSGAWYGPYVAAAVQAGLVQGLTATTFGPDQTVSREQMAVLLARALKLAGTGSLSFHDASAIDAYATASVQAAVAAGYLSGFPDGTFQPQGATTRAQAAKVLAMALQKLAPAQ